MVICGKTNHFNGWSSQEDMHKGHMAAVYEIGKYRDNLNNSLTN